MHFEVNRNDLLKALGRVHRVVERRPAIPILTNVQLVVDGTTLALRATDLDIEVRDSLPIMQVHVDGGCTVSAHMLHDIVKRLPEKAGVILEMDGQLLNVVSGRSKFALQTMPADDFPVMNVPDTNVTFTLPSAVFKGMMDRTQFAISTEETRYYLGGIYFQVVEGSPSTLVAVATDGHRLALTKEEMPDGALGMSGIIIPRKTVAELIKLLGETDKECTIEVSESKIRVSIGSFVLLSKLVDGTFPDYDRVIPKLNDKLLTIGHDVFAKAIDRVSTVSSDRGRAVKLSLASDGVHLDVSNPDAGTANDYVEGSYDGAPLEIGFNSRYLLDILGEMGSEVEVSFADPGSPTLFKSKGREETLFVLMPMRV